MHGGGLYGRGRRRRAERPARGGLLTRVVLLAPLVVVCTRALRIVVTNDDGFETTNIQRLASSLIRAGHDVILSAPYAQQSGRSGSVKFLEPIAPTAAPSPGGAVAAGSPGVGPTGLQAQQFYVDGTPAMACLYGVDVLAPATWGAFPDLVISGPNEGDNMGLATAHSGTVGAAVTALGKGIPAIALSAEDQNGPKSDIAAGVVAAITVKLVAALAETTTTPPSSDGGDDDGGGTAPALLGGLPRGVGLNVNIPAFDANATADDVSFRVTDVGAASNFGLRFYENLADSPEAVAYYAGGDDPGALDGFPGVSIVSAGTPDFVAAGYVADASPWAETNAIATATAAGALEVAVSPMRSTFDATAALDAGWCLPGSLAAVCRPPTTSFPGSSSSSSCGNTNKRAPSSASVGTLAAAVAVGFAVGVAVAVVAGRALLVASNCRPEHGDHHKLPPRVMLWGADDDPDDDYDGVGGGDGIIL